ncbi:hypothetical protein NDU88_003933 [Pleurodeles waltl]|uniref:Uncharacterized protein n=1 Tax=Pleurodeles waltl TaxID=8319 RepID=A0AAV7NIE9_PLEWA|nr:hypothetical protein NDU88_003933 [Pleurodeles waltl]
MLSCFLQLKRKMRQKKKIVLKRMKVQEERRRESHIDDENSDVEDLTTQLLRDRPPPLTTYSGGPGTIATATTAALAQAQGAEGARQAEDGQIPGVLQSTPNAGTTTVVQAQMHLPSVQRMYPDVPVLETVSNIMVPREQVLPKPMLVQTDLTPMLLPSAQAQGLTKFTPLKGMITRPFMINYYTLGLFLGQ